MNKLTKAVMLLSSAVLMVGLSACGGASKQDAPATTVQQQEPDYNRYMYNGDGNHMEADRYLFSAKKKLTDGRTTECVVYSAGNQGGITCDFANAK